LGLTPNFFKHLDIAMLPLAELKHIQNSDACAIGFHVGEPLFVDFIWLPNKSEWRNPISTGIISKDRTLAKNNL